MTSHQPEHFVALLQEMLSEIRTNLTGDPRDQCALRHPSPLWPRSVSEPTRMVAVARRLPWAFGRHRGTDLPRCTLDRTPATFRAPSIVGGDQQRGGRPHRRVSTSRCRRPVRPRPLPVLSTPPRANGSIACAIIPVTWRTLMTRLGDHSPVRSNSVAQTSTVSISRPGHCGTPLLHRRSLAARSRSGSNAPTTPPNQQVRPQRCRFAHRLIGWAAWGSNPEPKD